MVFVRRVKTSSGATAVQIVRKRGGVRQIVEHVGSAHDELGLAVLVQAARERINQGQEELDLGLDLAGDEPSSRARVVGTSSRVLWDVLVDAYRHLGFDVLSDEAFSRLVLTRLVEPTSKAEATRVLEEIGVGAPHVNTLHAALRRCQQRDYRARLATACLAHSARTSGVAAMVLYDVTTLHFERDEEDGLRRVGMSKEHRVDPQVQVGLLVDPGGFPLDVHLFPGNKAETTTIVPVMQAFQERHGVADVVVVADAGMLSADNLNKLEDAGFRFIVGSRLTKAPYDLAEHFKRKGDYFEDGQVLESSRTMGTGKHARARRVVYQWTFKRQKKDDKAINALVTKAEKIASGEMPMRRARFLKVTGATKEINETTIARARQLAGLKGYVTNLTTEQMDGLALIKAYHDLWQVETSFRLTKNDLRARPVFHHQRDRIEAHLTVVFASLAVTRYLTATTGTSLRKIVHTLRPLRSATISIDGHHITADPVITPEAREILDRLPPITGH